MIDSEHLAQDLLVVAVCGGARCAALRRLHDPTADQAGTPGRQLREAVLGRPHSILISTGCLGPCHRGCVAAIGTGRQTSDAAIVFTGRPVGLGLVELPQRAADLAQWVVDGAPDLAALPPGLWAVGAGDG